MSNFTRSGAYPWALVGIFAAVQLVMTYFPFTFAIGGGGILSLGLVSAPIIGYLLGPFFGTISVLIGSFLGVALNVAAHPLAMFTPIAPAASALVAGSLRVKKPIVVPIVYIAAIAIFLVSPIAGLSSTIGAFYFLTLGMDVPTLAGFYTTVIFIYPIERTLASIIAAFVIVALAKFLAKTYFDLPTTPLETRIQELPEEDIQ